MTAWEGGKGVNTLSFQAPPAGASVSRAAGNWGTREPLMPPNSLPRALSRWVIVDQERPAYHVPAQGCPLWLWPPDLQLVGRGGWVVIGTAVRR